MIVEEMTIEELLAWANGLVICTFKKQKGSFGDEIVCEKGQVSIKLKFMRFNESVPTIGGMRAISCHFYDNRNGGMSGGGGGETELSAVARFIERYAERLDLLDSQPSLFSLL